MLEDNNEMKTGNVFLIGKWEKRRITDIKAMSEKQALKKLFNDTKNIHNRQK
jgi:hypothetical protein